MKLKNALMAQLCYLSQSEKNLVEKAIKFCIFYHDAQMRSSGDFYYNHPLEVGLILSKMRVDVETLVVGILHDTLEDTTLTHSTLTEHFGLYIANLVLAVTKATQFNTPLDRQANNSQNIKRFLTFIASDFRVLIVKLADRLHNIRTLDGIKLEHKRYAIAQETINIYSVLAGCIGMESIKDEFEDVCFKIIYPSICASIIKQKTENFIDANNIIWKTIYDLSRILELKGVRGIVTGREKSPYSIWMKVIHKQINIENIDDLLGFRILVHNIADCYKAADAIHSIYQQISDKFQDFISSPKENGYKSIHTTIASFKGQKFEIQIRTYEMHIEAEVGIAAHWIYKLEFHKLYKKLYKKLSQKLDQLFLKL